MAKPQPRPMKSWNEVRRVLNQLTPAEQHKRRVAEAMRRGGYLTPPIIVPRPNPRPKKS